MRDEAAHDKNRELLPQLDVTVEELMACQLSLKLKTNTSDKHFYRSISMFKKLIPRKAWQHEIEGLPASLYRAKQELKKLCNVKPNYVVICPSCLQTVSESPHKVTQVECLNCPRQEFPPEKVQRGYCSFVTLPIREQIEQFTKRQAFKDVVTEFRKMPECHMKGKMHKGIVGRGDFDLTLTIDGSQLHRRQGRHSLPAALLFNNVPISLQLRYPILAAEYVGNKEFTPNRFIFLKNMVDQLKDLEENPIVWTDSDGQEIQSRCYLTCCISDAVEKCELMNHVPHNTNFSCPFCYIEGESITEAKYEKAWGHKLQKFDKTGKKTAPGGIKYVDLLHKGNLKRRDAKSTLIDGGVLNADGTPVVRNEEEEDDDNDEPPREPVNGVKGPPAIPQMKKFDIVKSHVSDTLHVVCHGVLRDLMGKIMEGHGKEHNLGKRENHRFQEFDEIRDGMTRCSETERKCRPLDEYGSKWTAYDELLFILHYVALYCSDPDLLPHRGVYQVLVHLSNIVYLSHFGRMTPEVIKQVEDEIATFTEMVQDVFTVEYCTHKYHILQHFPDFLRNHGNASWTDGFNMESLNLKLRNMNSAQHQEIEGMVRNFILLHHSTVLQDVSNYTNAVKQILHANGVETNLFTASLSTKIRQNHSTKKPPTYVTKSILETAESEQLCSREHATTNMKRLKSIRRNGMVLEISGIKKREKSSVKDCYIQVNNHHFGKIKEIFAIPKEDDPDANDFIIILKKFKKQIVTDVETGLVWQYPINQFPYLELPGKLSEFHTFHLRRDTFIQKAIVGVTRYKRFCEYVKIFSPRANEYFRQ